MYCRSWHFSALAACASLLFVPVAAVTQYNFVKEYAGETFFDDWSFYGNGALRTDSGCFSTCIARSRH